MSNCLVRIEVVALPLGWERMQNKLVPKCLIFQNKKYAKATRTPGKV